MNVWVEKYRPAEFRDIILDDLNRAFFEKIVDKKHFPNLLFYGPPGTGKTTTIINLINEYQTRYYRKNRTNILHLNASDERGIDIIRNQIYQFVKTNNLFEEGLKFVILDEVDYMTKNAQQALKYLLQNSFDNNNVRFCLVCNYISKIDDGLKDEFISVRFNQLPAAAILALLQRICQLERVSASEDMLCGIQTAFGSDVRSMINFLQLNQALVPAVGADDGQGDGARAGAGVEGADGAGEGAGEGGADGADEEGADGARTRLVLDDALYHALVARLGDASDGAASVDDNVAFVHGLSVEYNADPKSIIIQFFHFVVRRVFFQQEPHHDHDHDHDHDQVRSTASFFLGHHSAAGDDVAGESAAAREDAHRKARVHAFIETFQVLLDNDEVENATLVRAFVVKMMLFFFTQ